MKNYGVEYKGYDVEVKENESSYFLDFHTGAGEAEYPKADWTLEAALDDQYYLDNPEHTELY